MVYTGSDMRRVGLRIVYVGPAMSGKTANLEFLAAWAGCASKLSGAPPLEDPTRFFDHVTLQLAAFAGVEVRVDLLALPGGSIYTATQRAILTTADGFVFVADSSASAEVANLRAHARLMQLLASVGRSLDRVPHLYQWNKRDLEDALPVERLQARLNPEGAPSIEAIASRGIGVDETQMRLLHTVLTGSPADQTVSWQPHA